MSAGPEKELKDFESALAGLRPKPADLERDRLFFAAGGMRPRRLTRYFLAGNVLLGAACLYLGYLLWMRPMPAPEVKVVTVTVVERVPIEAPPVIEEPPVVPVPAKPPLVEPEPETPGSYPPPYGTIHKKMARMGEDALPTPPWFKDADVGTSEPERAGGRPRLFDTLMYFSLPRR